MFPRTEAAATVIYEGGGGLGCDACAASAVLSLAVVFFLLCRRLPRACVATRLGAGCASFAAFAYDLNKKLEIAVR